MFTLAVFLLALCVAFVEAPAKAYPSRTEWRGEARTSCILGAAALAIDLALPDAPKRDFVFGASLALFVFFADDFLYYVSHRLSHRVSAFWASHAVHHSPTRYNFFTGLRQPPTWILTPAALAPVLLALMGAPPVLIAASAGVRGLHHFIIHTERVRRLPTFVEFIFNTPSHHRVHHGSSDHCVDRNFGGVLIIWDRLFGTFEAEPEAGVERYGLLHPTGPGPWRTVADPWRALLKQTARAPSTMGKLAVLLGPPRS